MTKFRDCKKLILKQEKAIEAIERINRNSLIRYTMTAIVEFLPFVFYFHLYF